MYCRIWSVNSEAFVHFSLALYVQPTIFRVLRSQTYDRRLAPWERWLGIRFHGSSQVYLGSSLAPRLLLAPHILTDDRWAILSSC